MHTCSFLHGKYVSNYSCHLPPSSATLAASVKDRLMVAKSFFPVSIQRKGGRPWSLFTSDTSRASARACAAGELGGALMQ